MHCEFKPRLTVGNSVDHEQDDDANRENSEITVVESDMVSLELTNRVHCWQPFDLEPDGGGYSRHDS